MINNIVKNAALLKMTSQRKKRLQEKCGCVNTWVHTLMLVDAPVKTPQQSDTSFEELVISEMKDPPQRQESTTHRRCGMKSKVVTGDVYLQAIKEWWQQRLKKFSNTPAHLHHLLARETKKNKRRKLRRHQNLHKQQHRLFHKFSL